MSAHNHLADSAHSFTPSGKFGAHALRLIAVAISCAPLGAQAATWAPQNPGCLSDNFAQLGCWLPGAGGMPAPGDDVVMNSPLTYSIVWDDSTLAAWQAHTASGGTSPVTNDSLRVLNGNLTLRSVDTTAYT